jgi:DNA-directed RNA polymerase subunit M/transcription elongation factor TFIIS
VAKKAVKKVKAVKAMKLKKLAKAGPKSKKNMKGRPRGGASYLCSRCGSPSHVIITRRTEDNSVSRNRECLKCSNLFTTVEQEVAA